MAVEKLDYKRLYRAFYSAGREPRLVEVPELAFLMVDGSGDPNVSPAYQQAVEALFSLSYTIKFMFKRTEGGFDYGVMPLEGLWWTPDSASFATADRAGWRWTAMIVQPDELDADMLGEAIVTARAKRDLPAADGVRLERFHEGAAAQVMHVGPYAAEAATIERLHAFIADSGRSLRGRHHEIYLGDPRRTAPERLRTIIRQPVGPR